MTDDVTARMTKAQAKSDGPLGTLARRLAAECGDQDNEDVVRGVRLGLTWAKIYPNEIKKLPGP